MVLHAAKWFGERRVDEAKIYAKQESKQTQNGIFQLQFHMSEHTPYDTVSLEADTGLALV